MHLQVVQLNCCYNVVSHPPPPTQVIDYNDVVASAGTHNSQEAAGGTAAVEGATASFPVAVYAHSEQGQ